MSVQMSHDPQNLTSVSTHSLLGSGDRQLGVAGSRGTAVGGRPPSLQPWLSPVLHTRPPWSFQGDPSETTGAVTPVAMALDGVGLTPASYDG